MPAHAYRRTSLFWFQVHGGQRYAKCDDFVFIFSVQKRSPVTLIGELRELIYCPSFYAVRIAYDGTIVL